MCVLIGPAPIKGFPKDFFLSGLCTENGGRVCRAPTWQGAAKVGGFMQAALCTACKNAVFWGEDSQKLLVWKRAGTLLPELDEQFLGFFG